MKVNKISRRAFLLGLGAVSTAALLSVCGGSASSSSAASGSAASGSAAAAGSDVFHTLDEIKADGTVNIGVFSDKNPFGYVDENGEYQGYDVYFANRLGEDLGVEVNFVSTEAANRIEYLQTGKVDIIGNPGARRGSRFRAALHERCAGRHLAGQQCDHQPRQLERRRPDDRHLRHHRRDLSGQELPRYPPAEVRFLRYR